MSALAPLNTATAASTAYGASISAASVSSNLGISQDKNDKTIQSLAAKIPALKYMYYYTDISSNDQAAMQEIYLPSYKVIYNDQGYSFFADGPRIMESECTQIELDAVFVGPILETANLAKKLLESKNKLKTFQDVIFPSTDRLVTLKTSHAAK